MKKLNKTHEKELEEHRSAVEKAREELEAAIGKMNDAITEASDDVLAAVEKLNEAISDADNWRQEIAGEMQTYYDERTEQWQMGDAGAQYADWKDAWEQEFEQIERKLSELLEVPDKNIAEEIEQLPEEPGSL